LASLIRAKLAMLAKMREMAFMTFIHGLRWAGVAAVLGSEAAFAQPSALVWEKMPRMQLEQEYAGPMKDTVVQRWRDPQSGILCYLYVPFAAQHSPPTSTGYVQYGANTIGTISCVQPQSPARAAAERTEHPRPAAKHGPE
jgi:hypothetical protein